MNTFSNPMSYWPLALLLIFTLTHSNGETTISKQVTTTETTEYGPITVVLDSLAHIAVNVSDETTSQLHAKIERTVQDLSGDIEVLTTNALQQLSDSIHETNKLFTRYPSCNEDWDVNVLHNNVSEQLSNCSLDMRGMIESFSIEGKQLVDQVQLFVQEIAELPTLCQLMSSSPTELTFAGGTSCFMQGITEINKNMSLKLNEASMLLVRTRQAALQQMMQAQDCTNAVVTQIDIYLQQERENCEDDD